MHKTGGVSEQYGHGLAYGNPSPPKALMPLDHGSSKAPEYPAGKEPLEPSRRPEKLNRGDGRRPEARSHVGSNCGQGPTAGLICGASSDGPMGNELARDGVGGHPLDVGPEPACQDPGGETGPRSMPGPLRPIANGGRPQRAPRPIQGLVPVLLAGTGQVYGAQDIEIPWGGPGSHDLCGRWVPWEGWGSFPRWGWI